jgi:hypothetical protein
MKKEKLITAQLGNRWNPVIHYRVYKNPPLDCVLSHMKPFHILTIQPLQLYSAIYA